MRLFVALPVPRAAQQAIGDLIKDFAVLESPVRWVREEGLHLTLKFFGEVEESRVSRSQPHWVAPRPACRHSR